MTTKATGKPESVDPQIREFVSLVAQDYLEHGSSGEVELIERRRIAERVRERWRAGGPAMAEVRDIPLDNARLRLYRPTTGGDELPVLVYIHGGGWILFSIDTHDRLMREYAHRAGVAVLGIDYSLAPENKYPVALDEIAAALNWLEEEGDALGLDTGRIFIGGDSAGANLAVAACLRRREAGAEPLAGMVLNYGAFAPERTGSYALYSGPEYTLGADEMDAFWRAYIAHDGELDDPLVAPLKADLHDLPPAFLAIAECDILLDCNLAFARKLDAARVPVTAVTYRGATHSFLEAVSIAPLAGQALDDQAAWLRQLSETAHDDTSSR